MKVDLPEFFVDARYETCILLSVLSQVSRRLSLKCISRVHQPSLLSLKHSDFRQIPDHQEVYLDNTGKASIVLEVVERVEDAANDLEAMHVHLKDIVDPKDRLNFWWETPIEMPKLRYVGPFQLVALMFQLLFRPAAPIVSTLRHLYIAIIRIPF